MLSLRDPGDACLSCLFQWFALNPAMKMFLIRDSTVAFYARVMNYWVLLDSLMGDDDYSLRFEDLLADFPCKIRELFVRLDLPWDDAVLSYFERKCGARQH